jgi:hypothetical protein
MSKSTPQKPPQPQPKPTPPSHPKPSSPGSPGKPLTRPEPLRESPKRDNPQINPKGDPPGL